MNFTQQKLISVLIIAFSVWAKDTQALAATDLTGYTNTKQTLQQLIGKTMKKNRIVGLSIALVDDQTVVWAQGFGYADKAKKLKAAPETVYRVGSISKLFTATAAMQLVEQGKFDIDKPLQTYIPEFAIKTRFPDAGSITPRQLMTHHAGLPSDYGKGWENTPPEPFTELVNKLPDEYAAYPPNLILSYSNLGISLLGAAVENSCGAGFSVCLQQQLLYPLGMTDSEFVTGASASALMSKEYSRGKAVAISALRDVPAGGLNSNVLDLSRFMRMVFTNGNIDGQQVIAPATLREMLRAQNADVPLDLGQQIGLAWFLNHTTAGESIAWHNGGLGNFMSHLATVPTHKLGAVVLVNTGSADDVVGELANIALELMLAEKIGNAGHMQAAVASPAITPANEQDFPGSYASGLLGLVSIDDSRGHKRIKFNGQSYPLTPQVDGSMTFNLPGGTLTRAKLSDRQILIADGNFLLGEKIAQTPLPAIWRKRIGQYQVVNRDGDVKTPKSIRLSIKDGFLILQLAGFPDRVLTPVNDSEVIIAGLGRNLGDTIRFETTLNAEVIHYSGYLAERKKRNN